MSVPTYRENLHLGPYSTVGETMTIACRLCEHFPRRIPRWQEIADYLECSRSTAYRWRNAMQMARGHSERAA